jgi:3-phenylpropionate/trans-cinnamate dioxygenase ferredoxin reductase subunit
VSAAAATIVIVGGGQAAGAAVCRLRQQAFPGRRVVITDEPALPYERPGLSKDLLLGKLSAPRAIVGDAAPNERFVTGRSAIRIDRGSRTVVLDDDEEVAYDRLLLATGARPRRLDVPGCDGQGIDALRTAADAQRVCRSLAHCSAAGQPLLVVGGSWIGLEVAAAARARGIDVLLVERARRLCERTLPPSTAGRLQRMHRARGVDLRLGVGVQHFAGSPRVRQARLTDGSTLDIGAAVIGIGVVPNVDLATSSGLDTADGILVDRALRTSDPHVYAAGDVAEVPCAWRGRHFRYETWASANAQGALAADTMLRDLASSGTDEAAALPLPWFWSDQYDRTLQVIGHPLHADAADVLVDDDAGFVEAYRVDGRLVGAIAMGHGRLLRELRQSMSRPPR